MKDSFPFSAVVGQGDAQMALLLAAVDPSIGGVLLRGEKGSAKTTLARGLAALLPGGAPFVELPVGATEDRVLGSLDLRAALEGGVTDRFRPGLLAAAHGGVLYVDEVNLLPDHLVDALLDAAASGINRVERDGVSHEHPARFVLLGSMNPEEGELRPQLLDRFGLTVEVRTPRDPALRAEAVRRRLSHEADDAGPSRDDEALRWRLAAARPAALPDAVVSFASHLAVGVGAESLRADLVLCRAAAALAGWEGRSEATEDDVARVAPLALPHRRRRRPFDPPSLPPDDLADALAQARATHAEPDPDRSPPTDPAPATGHPGRHDDPTPTDPAPATGHPGRHDDPTPTDPGAAAGTTGQPGLDPTASPSTEPSTHGPDPGRPGADSGPGSTLPPSAGDPPRPSGGDADLTLPDGPSWRDLGGDVTSGPGIVDAPVERRPAPVEGRGRVVGHQRPGPDGPQGVAVLATVRTALARQATDPTGPKLTADDVREPRRAERQARTVVLCVDASGSMGTKARVDAATGAVVSLLGDAYLRRDQVALVAFRGRAAVEVLPATGSVELARARLSDLPTGGATPLAEGIATGLTVARRAAAKGSRPLLVLLTDGRATGEAGALDQAREAARSVAAAGIDTVVLDAEEPSPTALGLAHHLASEMNARYLPLAAVTPDTVESAVRHTLPT